jgi:HJR/Mrr/RecB family endonuclease
MLNGTGDIAPREFNLPDITPSGHHIADDPIIDIDHVARMKSNYLEGLAAALWQAQGYRHVYRTPDSGDDGVDVVGISGERGVLIQCKSSADPNRGLPWDAIKDVVTGKASYCRRHPNVAFQLICLTNQRFNTKARVQAELNEVTLIEASDIELLLQQYPVTLGKVEAYVFQTQ